MNRKNPETQRWQFYHPHFQRDFPQLRKNIKRKSARSMNTAPATSRVVFEHGKGYFLQRNDRSRSNSGEASHVQALAHIHHQSQRPEGRPTPSTSSPGHPPQMQPISPHLQRQSPPGAASSHNAEQRDRDHRSQFPHLYQQPDASRQRQQPYSNTQSGDHPYDVNTSESSNISHEASFARPPPPPSPYIGGGSEAQGYRSGRAHPAGNGYPGGEPGRDVTARQFHGQSASVLDHRKSSTQSGGSGHSSPLVRHQDPSLPHSQQRHHGSMGDSSMTSQSPRETAYGEPVEKDGRANNPGASSAHSGHPYGSPHHSSSHPSYHDSRSDRSHSMGGGPIPKDLSQPTPSLPSSNKFNTPPAPLQAVSSPAIPSPSCASSFPSTGHPQQQPPTSPPHADRSSPLSAKELETRLHFVEDAYMTLRQYAQKLEQAQASQDRTIQWMRERIDQMTDAALVRRGRLFS